MKNKHNLHSEQQIQKMQSLLLLLFTTTSTLAETYVSAKHSQQFSVLSSDGKQIKARSQIECVLKCRRMKYEALYKKNGVCLCVEQTTVTSKEASGGIEGTLYAPIKQNKVQESEEFNVTEETSPRVRSGLFNIIPTQTLHWELSIEFVVNSHQNFVTSILHFTKGGANDSSPSLIMINDALRISFPMNGLTSYYDVATTIGTTINIKVRQQRNANNTTRLKVLVDDFQVFSQKNHHATTYKNVKCYLGSPWITPADVIVKKLEYKKDPFVLGLDEYKCDNTQRYYIAEWPPVQWYVSFKIRINAVSSKNRYPLSFKKSGVGPYETGARIPAFRMATDSSQIMFSSYKENENELAVARADFRLGEYESIFMHQMLIGGVYKQQAFLNGKMMGEIVNNHLEPFTNCYQEFRALGTGTSNDVWVKDLDYGSLLD